MANKVCRSDCSKTNKNKYTLYTKVHTIKIHTELFDNVLLHYELIVQGLVKSGRFYLYSNHNRSYFKTHFSYRAGLGHTV